MFFLFVSILLIGCDSMCSGDKLNKDDLVKIEGINAKYQKDNYSIEIDKCFPLGYFNVTINNENDIDTLLLDKVFYDVLESGVSPKEMQVLNNKKELLFIQKNYYNPNTLKSKPIRLKLEDL